MLYQYEVAVNEQFGNGRVLNNRDVLAGSADSNTANKM